MTLPSAPTAPVRAAPARRAAALGAAVSMLFLLSACSPDSPFATGATAQAERDRLPVAIALPHGADAESSRLVGSRNGADFFLTAFTGDDGPDGVCIVVFRADSGESNLGCGALFPLTISTPHGGAVRYVEPGGDEEMIPGRWVRVSDELVVRDGD
ncbi:hypothetical protein [Cryobacterium sp. HLT2-28]|uniref:hypothetical protein n=1 Tax=Cryobacterium sp. HLT2-28 TaxID=1259146 RepID=UPI001068E535|nr:hypothetical protein [Cryobacterium sp. HLT2-28]TFB97538.1 hypothetical protein E3O48_02500 [Cryobacterium sp. HLT2-28]